MPQPKPTWAARVAIACRRRHVVLLASTFATSGCGWPWGSAGWEGRCCQGGVEAFARILSRNSGLGLSEAQPKPLKTP